MALTNWNDILNKPAAIEQAANLTEDVRELELSVADLSASVLEVKGEIDDVKELVNTTFTAGENVTIGSRNAIYKNNRLAYISLVLTTTGIVNHDSVIASINSSSNIRFLEGQYLTGEIDGTDLNNTVYMMTTTATGLVAIEDLPSGTIIRVGSVLPITTVTVNSRELEEPTETKKKSTKKKN